MNAAILLKFFHVVGDCADGGYFCISIDGIYKTSKKFDFQKNKKLIDKIISILGGTLVPENQYGQYSPNKNVIEKITTKRFFDFYTGFRISNISVECSVHICSCP